MIFINSKIIKISKILSNLFNPIISLVIYFFYFNFKNLSISSFLSKFVTLGIIVILPVIFWIYRGVKSGKYSNADVSDRIQRQSLYIFLITSVSVFLLVDYLIYKTLDWTVFFLVILLIIMKLSNYFIKSSMHTGLNIYVAFLFYLQNQTIGLIWFILTFFIAITRLILKRHTLKEIISGAIISIIISYIYLLLIYDKII